VGRVEVGEDEDAHRLTRLDEFRMVELGRQSPQPRVNRIAPPIAGGRFRSLTLLSELA
jgi:hypothetical protein